MVLRRAADGGGKGWVARGFSEGSAGGSAGGFHALVPRKFPRDSRGEFRKTSEDARGRQGGFRDVSGLYLCTFRVCRTQISPELLFVFGAGRSDSYFETYPYVLTRGSDTFAPFRRA